MCKENVLTIAAVAILALAIGQVQARTVTVPIDNPGFEDSVVADGEYDYSLDNQGWGYFDNDGEQGAWNPGLPGTSEPGYGGNAPEGQNVGWACPGGVGVPGGFAQVLTDADATLMAGMTYTLTVEVGNTLGYPWSGYKVQLLAGGTPHTPGTGGDYTGPVTGGTLLAEDNNSLTIAEDTFETSTVTYTYDPELHSGLLGEPLQIRLLSLGNVAAGDYTEADFDNVTLVGESLVPLPLAYGPDPGDGEMIEAIAQLLRWKPGDLAVSHNVYLGDNLDVVDQATPDDDAFMGNQSGAVFVAQNLTAGATYYWRIDEVNDTHPDSPWKGDIWSFRVKPAIAWDPTPADGGQYVLTDPTLTWEAGTGTLFHTVYFGESFDEVNDATTGGWMIVDATYDPGPLEIEKTYYWRVDESTGVVTHKGDVWSFTTLPDVPVEDPHLMLWWTLDEGQGISAVDWSGHGHHGTLNGDAQWVDGYQGTALTFADDVYVEAGEYPGVTGTDPRTLCAWIKTTTANRNIMSWGQNVAGQKWRMRVDATGGLRIEVNGGYHYGVTNLADGQWHHVAVTFEDDGTPDALDTLLYVDGQPEATAASLDEPINTAATGAVRIGESPWHNAPFVGVIDDARIYDKVLTEEELQHTMRGNPLLASSPNPNRNAVVDVRAATSLSWRAGDTAASHDVYFGTDRGALAMAGTDAAEFQGNQAATGFSLAGLVEFGGGDYYWRIDEVEADGTVHAGNVWKFTVPDYLIVDDFESYTNEVGSRVFEAWIDGAGFTQPVETPGNGSGALVGHDIWTGGYTSLMETGNVYDGSQAMPIYYDNTAAPGYSQADHSFTPPQDWTVEGVTTLVVHLRGETGNTGQVYIEINGVRYDAGAPDVASPTWVAWEIDLASVGVTLTSITQLSIGVEGGGSGVLYVDAIRLVRP